MTSTCATMTVWSAIVDSFEIMLETRQPGDPRGRAGARRRAIHRGGDRRSAAAAGDVPVFPQPAAGLAGDRGADRGAGLSGAALSVRAADAAADREPGRLPRKPGKLGADHRAEPARRRDRRRRARIVRHAARPGVDAASEEPARRARACGLQDQPRSAQPAGVLAIAVGPARQRARSAGAALCAETDALAGARHRVLPVDAVLWPRAGGRARPPHDPGRARGRRGARIRRACRRRLDHLDQRDRARAHRSTPIPTSCFACCSIWCATPRRRWKASRKGDAATQQIRITGRREGTVAIIEVSDTGPGVPAKAREHLFEAFQTSGRPGGSGLGLAIAAELVRAHGGDIHLVEGTIGATFRIAIPDRPVELQSVRNERARA